MTLKYNPQCWLDVHKRKSFLSYYCTALNTAEKYLRRCGFPGMTAIFGSPCTHHDDEASYLKADNHQNRVENYFHVAGASLRN